MKLKKCKVCDKIFTPKQYAVSKTKCEQCIKVTEKAKRFEYLKKQFEKPLKKRFSEQNPTLRAKHQIDKEWIKVAKLVKERDAGKPCISCGKTMQPHEIQAGHFISRAKSKELYYDMRNIHAQCWNCNNNHQRQQETKKGFTNGLIARYGIEYVEWLDANK